MNRFLIKILGGQKAGSWQIQKDEGKILSTENICPAEVPFKNEGEIKTYLDKHKLYVQIKISDIGKYIDNYNS